MFFVLLYIFLACEEFYFAYSCSPRRPSPRPCSWRTCHHEWTNPYQPGVRQGQCVHQSRASKHIYYTHRSTAPCPGSQSCDWRTQSRTRCSCRHAYRCSLRSWTSWSGHVPNNQCSRQTRYRDWSETVTYVERDYNCNGVRSSCGSREYDYRTYCKCQYLDCETLPWTSWSEVQTEPGHCRTEARYQRQRKTVVYREQMNNCNGVGPQTCPQDVTSKREKVIYCPPLPRPTVGMWDNDQCSQSRRRCNSHCTLECTGLQGYTRMGSPTRTCLRSGSWSSSDGYCKDISSPVIICPSPVTYGNDPGKTFKRVTLPEAASVSDNSGKKPSVTTNLGTTQHDFHISKVAHEVVYTARDEAGLADQCTWYVTVKDTEKPKVLSCPEEVTKVTTKNPARVAWDVPTFKDNYDKKPVIDGNKVPGTKFPYGRTKVWYQAVDSYGNVATCQFYVIVSPFNCSVFDAPRHGARSCNVKVNENYDHHLYCTTHCQEGYAYMSDSVFDVYQCAGGQWEGINNFPPMIVPFTKTTKPWVDCTEKDKAEGVKKVINAYVGKCNENDPVTLAKIKQDFLTAVNNHIISKLLFCKKHERNCDIKNVKVYCGKNKRSGDTAMQVISLEIVIHNKNGHSDEAQALKEHVMMKMDLDAAEIAADEKIVTTMGISRMHVEGYKSRLSCKDGEVVHVDKRDKDEVDRDELERSSCIKCAEGTYYDKEEEECISCPAGTFQDQEGETSCKKCPEGTWTVTTQACNQTECVDICGPGEYSQEGNGLANCLACPLGTYQPNFRQSSCMKCPNGKSTKVLGTASKDECE